MEDKAQLFAAKLSESMHRSRMQYRIQGARMLTGGKSLFLNLPDKLQEVCAKLPLLFAFFSIRSSERERESEVYCSSIQSLKSPEQIYSEVIHRDPVNNRASMVSKFAEEEDDLDLDEHRALIEFSSTSYAALEREQRVDLKVKRRGPTDVGIRFRCLIISN